MSSEWQGTEVGCTTARNLKSVSIPTHRAVPEHQHMIAWNVLVSTKWDELQMWDTSLLGFFPECLILILHQILTKASLWGPQATEPAGAIQSTRLTFQAANGPSRRPIPSHLVVSRDAKADRKEHFLSQGTGKPLICILSMNIISNWRINIWTTTELWPQAYKDSKHDVIFS